MHRKPLKQPTEQNKALQHKYRSRREEDQHLRRQAHRNAAKQAKQANKAPLEQEKHTSPDPVPKFPYKGSRSIWETVSEKRWLIYRHEVRPLLSLSLTRIPRLCSRILYHSVEYDLDLDDAPELHPTLRRYVSALFRKGVHYHIEPNTLFVTKKQDSNKRRFWGLFLGGWAKAEFHPDLVETDPEEWKGREKRELDEIDRVFVEARRLHIEALPRIEELKERGPLSSEVTR